ncbi:hypothetical protein ACFSCX_09000 [Bacillus salitolerans]|uniref:RNA polymerase subunit sigma-70 n=1 Tax=Bacillus salitolerans TaxID=1437434 RepID=A0ABW4LPT3_9BACI
MRFSEKGEYANNGNHQIFGMNFHDFIQNENNNSSMELASEFGLSLREVRQLKKQLGRS